MDAATWHTPDSAIVRVAPHGVVKGLVPGVFQLEATVEGRELHARGFVLPPGWRVRLSPDSFDVRVGDTLRLQVRAETADGVMLPAVPSRLVTPEYLDWAREVIPDMHAGRHTRSPDERGGLFDRTFFQSTEVGREGVFVARRAGVTMLVGSIGSRAETARVVVRPAAAPRQ